MKTASIGFRAKTGRAIVVVVSAGAAEPVVVLRRENFFVRSEDPRYFPTSSRGDGNAVAGSSERRSPS